jgi:hypothetical protein
MLAAGCAGGELDGLDAGRQNPDGTPRGGTGVTLDGGDVRASETDAGMDPDAEMDGHVDVTPPEPESRVHCILSDASVSHLGVQSVAIGPEGGRHVVVGGDAVRLFSLDDSGDWTETVVSPYGDAPSIAATADGLAIAWVERFGAVEPGQSRVRFMRRSNGAWKNPVTIAQVSSAPAHDTQVDLVVDDSDTPWVAWFQETEVGQVLRVARFDAGAWDVDTIEHGARYLKPDIELGDEHVVVGMTAPTHHAVVQRTSDGWGPVEELRPSEARSSDDLVMAGGAAAFVLQFEPHPSWGAIDSTGQEVFRCDSASNGDPLASAVLDDGTITTIRGIYETSDRYTLAATSGCDETPIAGSTHRRPEIHEFVGGYTGSKVAALFGGSLDASGDIRLFAHFDQETGTIRAVSSVDGGTTWDVDNLMRPHGFGYSPAVASDDGRSLVASVDLGGSAVWVSEKTDDGWESRPVDLGGCRVTEVAEGTVDIALSPERAYLAAAVRCPDSHLRVKPRVFREAQGGWEQVGTIDYDRVGEVKIDLAVAPDGNPGLVLADSLDVYRYEWTGTGWDTSSISTLSSLGEGSPHLSFDADKRVTVVSVLGGLDAWVQGDQGSDRVGIDHVGGPVAYDVAPRADGRIALAHATRDDDVVTVRYLELELQGGSAAVVADEFVTAFTSSEPAQGLDLRVGDQAAEILLAPGDGRPLRHLTRNTVDSWSEVFVDAGDDTAWFPRFLGPRAIYHDRARGDLCVTDL